ncbi:MAG: malic enzyme-like NAD(P)-binding protein [Atribacterota bacterium]|jgi:malate dehydrogenase (oxaloacetate-decarboxylating)|nr:malic enzyme-like NAD(P)-binding protein [Atribacterota bacterium]
MDINQEALKLHSENKGKIEVISKTKIKDMHDLAVVYTPGVAEPCRKINEDVSKVYEYTSKGNMVAVVSDGTAVLGLGDIGPEAAIPVMEGKAVLFKYFAGVDAFPICLSTKDPEKIIEAVTLIAPVFGGINLEDISAPRCFEIERRLKETLDIPVFHDDQHGTAVVVLSGLLNALKLVNKKLENAKIVVNGAGSASIAVAKFIMSAGAQNVILCDSKGAIYEGRENNMNSAKEEMAKITNKGKVKGSLADALVDADVFLGLSAPNVVNRDMVKTMADDPIIFAMANPTPEILPDEAKAGGARIIATGRSDFPNQVNNCLGFPAIFKGALRVRASAINEEMKIAAAQAISSCIPENELSEDNIIPNVFHPDVMKKEADAVAKAAIESGVARITDIK